MSHEEQERQTSRQMLCLVKLAHGRSATLTVKTPGLSYLGLKSHLTGMRRLLGCKTEVGCGDILVVKVSSSSVSLQKRQRYVLLKFSIMFMCMRRWNGMYRSQKTIWRVTSHLSQCGPWVLNSSHQA